MGRTEKKKKLSTYSRSQGIEVKIDSVKLVFTKNDKNFDGELETVLKLLSPKYFNI